jgi:SWI/SNF-related matrix-associated actin-dependent regulator 1 of chromatin subfamily A
MYELWRRAGGEEKLKAVIDGQEKLLAAQIDSLKNTKAPMRNLIPILTGMEKGLAELRQYTGMAKVPALLDMVTRELTAKLEDGGIDKIVIFACHRAVIESLRQGLRKFGAVTLYGGTAPESRQRNIDKFQNNPKCRVFIANIQAAGTAVTLTAACEVIFAECDWTPANNAQAAMRVHRISQTRPVRVRYATLADSTDEHLTETLRRKTRDELAVFGN